MPMLASIIIVIHCNVTAVLGFIARRECLSE